MFRGNSMKLTALIAQAAVAGTMMLATAPAHSAAVVFEAYDYAAGDAATAFVTNTSHVAFDDVTFFGSYLGQTFHFGPLAVGASTTPFYLGDNENDFPGSQGNVTVSILIGTHTYTGTFADVIGDPDIQVAPIQIGSIAAGAVPEPATWGLMLSGFGLLGGAMRYGRRKTVAA
jgi:hypothetical protein